jgi:hypothetical protein
MIEEVLIAAHPALKKKCKREDTKIAQPQPKSIRTRRREEREGKHEGILFFFASSFALFVSSRLHFFYAPARNHARLFGNCAFGGKSPIASFSQRGDEIRADDR